MNQREDFDFAKASDAQLALAKDALEAEQARQVALGKISRRYAAYMVPAALAVLSNRAAAGS